MSVPPIPIHHAPLIPNLPIRDGRCAEAIGWYCRHFGAAQEMRIPSDDGTIAHASLSFGISRLYLYDFSPLRQIAGLPEPGGFRCFLFVEDVDATTAAVLADGASQVMSPTTMFWGDRIAVITDPFGHAWTLSTQLESLSEAEILERMRDLH